MATDNRNTATADDKQSHSDRIEVTDADVEYFANLPRAFDEETMVDIDKAAACRSIGQSRSCTLAVLTKSMAELEKLALDDGGVFDLLSEKVAAFKTHVEGLMEMAEAASVRMFLADVRDPASDAQGGGHHG